jgi:hypothetical protein
VYFFCGSDDGRNTGAAILRGLLYQLLVHSERMFKSHVEDAFSKHQHRLFADDRFETLWNVFEATVRDPIMGGITCILDGLDECVEESLIPLLIKLYHLFKPGSPSAPSKSEAHLKIIVTSRNYPDSLEDNLHSFLRLQLDRKYDDKIRKDVERYIDARMDEPRCSERLKPTLGLLRANIRRTLLHRANGTYLWVKFAISSLEQVQCPRLEAALDEFPTGLDGMYRRMFVNLRQRTTDRPRYPTMGGYCIPTLDSSADWHCVSNKACYGSNPQ